MECTVYGKLVAVPIDFPNEVQLRVLPHDRETRLELRGSYPYIEHKSWRWLRETSPLMPHEWSVIEERLKNGLCAEVGFGEFSMDLPDGAEGPGIIRVAGEGTEGIEGRG